MLTKNEAQNIASALASVPAGAPSLVIDAESRDETVALARAHGARVVIRPWQGFVATRRFALELAETPWTFMLDADERLDPALAHSLACVDAPKDTDGYRVARTTYVCGRPMLHGAWGREAPLRLFRTARATLVAQPAMGGSADVHERWVVRGATGTLAGSLLHDSYPTLRAYREKFERYTDLEARGRTGSWSAFARAFALAPLRAGWTLLRRGGWRDGWRGVFVALASAWYPVAVARKALRTAARDAVRA